MNYYVETDTNGFVTSLSKEDQDGLNLVFVPDAWEDNFVRYFDKFRVNNKGILTNPGNLPEVSLSDLETKLNQTQLSQQTALNSLASILNSQVQSSAEIENLNVLASQMASVVTTVTKVN